MSIVYSRIGGNIVSFPTQYISHEKHKYAPICTPWDRQFAMRIFINRTSFFPLPTATTWVKGNTHKVGIPLNLISDIFHLLLHLFCIFLSRILSFVLLLPIAHIHKYCTSCIFSSTHLSSYYMLHIFPYVFLLSFFSSSHMRTAYYTYFL